MLELILLDSSGRRFPLEEGTELMVGVASHCSVRLCAPDVSRAHALLTSRNGRTIVLDLGSTNGTFVNGKRIKETELAAGDLLRFSSIIAQVFPPGSDSEGEGRVTAVTSPEAQAPPDDPVVASPTSDKTPVLVHESIGWLLSRWSAAGHSAQEELVEWLVSQRGHRGAAVLEKTLGDITVVAAEGDIGQVLENAACESLLHGRVETSTTPEEIITTIGGKTVVAMKSPGLPWLLLVPGPAMPDFAELSLMAPLLAVARRLDQGR